MKDGRAKLLARYLACMPDKQVEPLPPSNLSGREQVTSKGHWARAGLSQLEGGQTTERSGHTRKTSSYRVRRSYGRFPRKGARIIG